MFFLPHSPTGTSMKIAVLVPTYNEAGNIGSLLTSLGEVGWRNPDVSLRAVVVDDSSPDGTADLAKLQGERLCSDSFSVRVLVREKKEGLGMAYIHGFRTVLGGSDRPDYVLQMDADLSHDPRYIDAFLEQARKGADFIVGTRYMEGGATPDWSWYRKLLSRGGNFYARAILGSTVTDYTGGFNMYAAGLLDELDLDTLSHIGYGFLVDLKYRAMLHSQHLAQVPIVFVDRQLGNSKMPANTIVKNFLLVPRIRYRHWKGKST